MKFFYFVNVNRKSKIHRRYCSGSEMLGCNGDFHWSMNVMLISTIMLKHNSRTKRMRADEIWRIGVFQNKRKTLHHRSSKTKYSIASKSEADCGTKAKWLFVLQIWKKNILQKCEPQNKKLTFGVIEMSLLWFWIDWRNAGSKMLREQLDSVFTNIFCPLINFNVFFLLTFTPAWL